eukprot:1148759-Pelagomonas_calceolata.AAC.3
MGGGCSKSSNARQILAEGADAVCEGAQVRGQTQFGQEPCAGLLSRRSLGRRLSSTQGGADAVRKGAWHLEQEKRGKESDASRGGKEPHTRSRCSMEGGPSERGNMKDMACMYGTGPGTKEQKVCALQSKFQPTKGVSIKARQQQPLSPA